MIGNLRTASVAALAVLFALSACGGGSSSRALPGAAANPNTTYQGPASLADFSWGKDYLAQARYLGPATFGTATVEVQVRMQNEQGLLQYAQAASDPHSPLYRHFLTPQEIGDRFGASAADYAAAARYFESYGLAVGGWPQRELLHVSGTQAHLEAAFGTKFGGYTRAGQTFLAPIQAPHFSRPVPVSAVLGLMSAHVNKPYIIIPPRASNADFFGYSSQQIATGFDFTGAYQAGYTGAGITVGIIGTGPISTGPRSDVAAYGVLFHTPMATVNIVPAAVQPVTAANPVGTCKVDTCTSGTTGLATPPAVTAPCTATNASTYPTATCNPEDGEAQLDTEQVASLAYGATVDFYLAFNKTDCAVSGNPYGCPTGAIGVQGLNLADDEIQQAIADNTADVVSLSYGGGEINQGDAYVCASGTGCTKGTGIGPTEFASLAAEGIAVFASSGDSGAEECSDATTGNPLAQPCVSYPSGDPNVVSVGGVNAPMNNFGQLISQITAWGDLTTGGGDGSFSNNIGSGGGTSQIFTAPSWQATNVGASMREQPDIALMADPNTGPAIVQNAPFGANVGASGGTSAAAPEAAAEWALVLQACKASSTCSANGAKYGSTHAYRLGDPAPLLYDTIYGVNGANALYATTFYDVLAGTNNALPPTGTAPSPTPIAGCCAAGKGYDEVTGLGVPFGGHLIQAVTGQTAP